MKRTVSTLLVAALVVLAGCAGGIAGPETGATGDSSADSTGTVQFYVSDERNAIDQFDHLNVTVTSVGFAKAGTADANETGSETDIEFESESEGGLAVALIGNFTPGENATVRATYDGEQAANVTADVQTGDREESVRTDANGTATVAVPENATEFELKAETDSDGAYGEGEAEIEVAVESESESADDGEESEDGWVERDVDDRSVDLTELQGANATALGNLSVPEGDYEKVFVHVGEVNGTLDSGEQVDVKLPSQKLQLNEGFTVDSDGGVDFVFDVTVFEAGNSEKYVLKPVASESGTDVPIVDVDKESELDVGVVGSATAGENATVQVTRGGEPVENATVAVDDGATVRTDANGTASVLVPEDDEVEFEAEFERGDDEAESELELDLGDSERDDGSDDSDAGGDSDADADGGDSEGEDGDSGDTSASAEADLAVAYEGTFAAGETVTVSATDGEGEAVEDATVELDGEVVGETDENGDLAVELPADVSMHSQLTVTDDGESVTVDASTVAAAN